MPQLLTIRSLVFLNCQRGKIIPAPVDEDADSQFDEVTVRKLDGARKTFVKNSADLFTWHYFKRTSQLSTLQRTLSSEERLALLSPLPSSPIFVSRTIDNVPVSPILQSDDNRDSTFDNISRLRIYPTSTPSARHRVPAIRLLKTTSRQRSRALLSSQQPQKIVQTGDKKDHDPVLNPVIIILAMLINAGIRPGDFISHPRQSKGSSAPSIFMTGSAGERKLGLRLTRNSKDLVITFNNLEMTIRDLLALNSRADGSQPALPADWIEQFIKEWEARESITG